MALNNENIGHKVLAFHFQSNYANIRSATEAMRQLKAKHVEGETDLWTTYVKAYNFDKGYTTYPNQNEGASNVI